MRTNALNPLLILVTAFFCLAAAGCLEPPKPVETKPAAPVFPPEVVSAAQAVLGAEAEVLLHGDLSRTGQTQILAVNRLKVTPQNTVPGTLITRAALLGQEEGKWREIFRCDEHLKNTRGYLAATPLAPVNGWRLQLEQSDDKGLLMYFTPLAQPAGGYVQTIGVRWNPKAGRYQSLNRTYEQFLGETPVLESPGSNLRR